MENRSFSHLVVVGASAGGIEAVSKLLSTLPEEFPAPVVVAQHLNPAEASNLEDILSRNSALPVRTLLEHNSLPLEPGTVFVVPSDRHVDVTDSDIWLREDYAGRPKPSINLLLESATGYYGDRLTAVILTGTGSDGSDGARVVKKAGGTVIIQNPDTAAHSGMPRSLAPSAVDIVSDLENIGKLLGDLLSGLQIPEQPSEKRKLEEFLDEIRTTSGIDFRSYKTPTIMRRLQRRIVATGSGSLDGYVQYLKEEPEERQRLISAFLIKVTEFFRDPELFEYLRAELVPELVARAREDGEQLRIWSAGCATGEEAYSLAILVSEALGEEAYHFSVRIFATDADEKAIDFARRGIYPTAAVSGLPEELLDRYFTREDGHYQIRKTIRSMIIFGQHDLSRRAPFPRLDLVICRNVLIYFTPELQKHTLQLFAYSLKNEGYLLLGKSETAAPLGEHFAVHNKDFKVYRRQGERFLLPPVSTAEPTALTGGSGPPASGQKSADREASAKRRQQDVQRRRQEQGPANQEDPLVRLPVGVVVIDRRYDIQSVNAAARRLLSIGDPAVGEDLLHLVRGAHYADLRAAIDTAFREARSTEVTDFDIEDLTTGEYRYLQMVCYPRRDTEEALQDSPGTSVMIAISDVTSLVRERNGLQEKLSDTTSELERVERVEREDAERKELQNRRLIEANRQLTEANQELTSLNEELQATSEEYMVSNEEAQAATEEVETLNEELQATNEELETLNEELQSTIEELNTTNEDLNARSQELQDLARSSDERYEESENDRRWLYEIFARTPAPTLVLQGAEPTVRLVNAGFERLSDRPASMLVGRSLQEAFPEDAEGFEEAVSRLYATAETQTVSGERTLRGRFTCEPLLDAEGQAEGAIIQAAEWPEA